MGFFIEEKEMNKEAAYALVYLCGSVVLEMEKARERLPFKNLYLGDICNVFRTSEGISDGMVLCETFDLDPIRYLNILLIEYAVGQESFPIQVLLGSDLYIICFDPQVNGGVMIKKKVLSSKSKQKFLKCITKNEKYDLNGDNKSETITMPQIRAWFMKSVKG